ncbi:MAG: tyrosine-type recombinase/integrase [Methylococcaceae bacterium]
MERRYETRNNDEWVFTNKSGKAPRNYQPKGINKAFERAGLKDYTLYDLRHDYASKMVRNGMTLYQV